MGLHIVSFSRSPLSSQLWLLLSQEVTNVKATVIVDDDEYQVEEIQLHEKVVIVTLPSLPLSSDVDVTVEITSEAEKATLRIPYTAERLEDGSSQSPLVEFSRRSDPLALLESFSSQINRCDEEGNNCLHIAAKNSQNYAIKLLLSAIQREPIEERREAVSHRNDRGETPLHLAVRSNDGDAVHYLLSAGAQITITDRHSNSVLHYLAESHNDAIHKEVLERSLDPSHLETRNDDGLNPLHLAVRRLKLSLIEMMLDVSDDTIDLRDGKGRTALLHAIQMNDHEIVAYLLARGADPNVEDDTGMNALLLSNKVGSYIIMGQLLDSGADPNKETKIGEKLADVEDEMVMKIIQGERPEAVFKVEQKENIDQRRGEIFDTPQGVRLSIDDEDLEDEDQPGPSTSIRSTLRSGLSLGKDDVSCLDYLTRLRLSKVLDSEAKWEVLARELECEHMIDLISICATDSSPTMILLDQFEQLPNSSITRIREALNRTTYRDALKIIDDRIVY